MAGTTSTEDENSSIEESRTLVVEAALRCFKRLGPQKTSMSDIARDAGISRKTIYRLFNDRPTLVNEVLFKLLRGMSSKAKKALEKYSNFKDAIIEGSIEHIKIGQKEELLQAIVKTETNYMVEHFLVQGNEKIRNEMVKIWSPIFQLGRSEGLLRTDLSDDRLAELIQNVHSLARIREDRTDEAQRAFLEDLLWAAITNRRPDQDCGI